MIPQNRAEFVGIEHAGRWPANVALGHSETCELVGTTEMHGGGHTPSARPSSTFAANGQDGIEERSWVETVEVWDCSPDCAVRQLNAQTGDLGVSAGGRINKAPGDSDNTYGGGWQEAIPGDPGYGDSGGAARFFYQAKVSRAERNAGLDGFVPAPLNWSSGEQSPGTFQSDGTDRSARNSHPTVKPIDLMRWLIRLVTPPGGVVLDPFLGSGSTGCAAVLEPTVGRFVGIERDPDYLSIAEARIRFWHEHGEDALDVVRTRAQSDRVRAEAEEAGQLDLFAAGPLSE